MTTLAESNSLTDLAARIRVEHYAAAEKLTDAMRHAMTAGELLIEAKALVKHGQWLPWLTDHVTISERTAQLYMRLAKNRAEIEAAKAQHVADLGDLTLNEAAALLMLGSDVKKLFAFAKEIDGLSGEALVQACIDANVGIVTSPGYDPFAGRSDDERREWLLFTLWLATRQGRSTEWAAHHVEWLLQRPFQNVTEWMSEEGDRVRARWLMRPVSGAVKMDWSSFAAERGLMTQLEIEAEIDAAHDRFKADIAAGTLRLRGTRSLPGGRARNEKRPRKRRA